MIAQHFATNESDAPIFTNIPIDEAYYTIYNLLLPDLKDGDVVDAQCQLEVTNDLVEYDVEVSQAMMLQLDNIIYDGSQTWPGNSSIVRPCYMAGEVVCMDTMHHGFRSLSGTTMIKTSGLHNYWLSVVLCCTSTGSGSIKVEGSAGVPYGGLSAVLFRK